MEDNKYYKPDISEFYFGFEIYLQSIENAQWGRYIWKDGDCVERLDCEYRVKLLDREDIEECGWIFVKQHPGLEEIYLEKKAIESIDDLGMNYDPESNWLRVYDTWPDQHSDITRFSGKIKNKSELKILMKQLSIK